MRCAIARRDSLQLAAPSVFLMRAKRARSRRFAVDDVAPIDDHAGRSWCAQAPASCHAW